MADDTASPEATSNSKFTEELRATSKRQHSLSNALVNSRLVVLFTDRALYGRAIACFYFVFRALEDALDAAQSKGDPELARFASILPKLYRAEGFGTDLDFYLTPQWAKTLDPTPAVRKYQQHLAALAAGPHPSLLLAHAYTQHLAMIGGGQIIRRIARKQMGLPEDQGTAAFDFPEGTSPSSLANTFKDTLNTLAESLPADMRQRLTQEHLAAFRFNSEIITSFRIGWAAFFRGLLVLLLRNLSLALMVAGLVTAVLLAVALRYR